MLSNECFRHQVERLQARFGEKAFDQEFCSLVINKCRQMRDVDFVDLVNHLIGTRAANRPPLITDFQEGRDRAEKNALNRDIHGALKAFDQPWSMGLKEYLAREFPGCKNLKEAVEVRKLQIQLAKANNPKYDPMMDPKRK